jgi:protein TonB
VEVKPVEVVNPNAAPVEEPEEIKAEPVDTNFDRNTGVEGGIPGGVVGGVVGGLPEAPPPPPPPPTQPVRVGGQIKQPTKTKHVNPQYPPIAQSARVQGVVIIEAVIGPNGRVQDARVLRSIPLLDQAALDAVKQWEFTPTLLNNVPVPVIMTVTVQFTLS